MVKLDFFKKISQYKRSKTAILFLSFVIGAIGAIPYYFEKLFVFTFVSLFLEFYIVISQRRANKGVFMPFFLYFFGFYSFVYLFLSELYPFERFGFNESQAIFVVICSCLLIPLLHAFVEALILSISKYSNDNAMLPITIASLWVAGEAILTVGNLAFPWATISVSLTGWLPYLQTASLFGSRFVTFITVFACCIFAYSIIERKKAFALLGLFAISFNIITGYVLWFIPTKQSDSVECAIVQGNVLSNEKWSYANRQEIFDRYISMTEEAAKNGAELILLPESAIPSVFTENGKIHNALSDITQKYNVTVILGINYYTDNNQYNSVIAVMPDGSLSERYDKRHLVPFGEFIPFADSLGKLVPFVGELSADSGEYVQGEKYAIISTENTEVAPLVCFDSIFPEFSREATKNGATALAVVTNDSWFNDSAGIYTHLRHSQIRAIENRRYILRAANTGVSAFVNQRGEIIDATQPLEVDIAYAEIYNNENTTPYTYTGDVVVCFILFIILSNLRRKKNGKDTAASI